MEKETVYKVVTVKDGEYLSALVSGPWEKVYKTRDGIRPWVESALAFMDREDAEDWLECSIVSPAPKVILEAEAYGVEECISVLDLLLVISGNAQETIECIGLPLYEFLVSNPRNWGRDKTKYAESVYLPPRGTVVCRKLRTKEEYTMEGDDFCG